MEGKQQNTKHKNAVRIFFYDGSLGETLWIQTWDLSVLGQIAQIFKRLSTKEISHYLFFPNDDMDVASSEVTRLEFEVSNKTGHWTEEVAVAKGHIIWRQSDEAWLTCYELVQGGMIEDGSDNGGGQYLAQARYDDRCNCDTLLIQITYETEQSRQFLKGEALNLE